MANEDAEYVQSFSDFQRFGFRYVTPGMFKTYDDEFMHLLYTATKRLDQETMNTIFPSMYITEALRILSQYPKLQKKINPGAFVLGLEYNRLCMSQARLTNPDLYTDLFNRGLKCGIPYFDILRYNRLIFQLEKGDNTLQYPSATFKVSMVDVSSGAAITEVPNPDEVGAVRVFERVRVEPSSSKGCPPFDPTISSRPPEQEGTVEIRTYVSNEDIITEHINLYKFDTVESIVRKYCVERLEVPFGMVDYGIDYHSSSSKRINTKEINTTNVSGQSKKILVEYREDEMAENVDNYLNRSTITIRPITLITNNENLTLEETAAQIREMIEKKEATKEVVKNAIKEIFKEITEGLCYTYFICFGLLSSQELFDDSFTIDQLWNEFLVRPEEPWISIPAETRFKRLTDIRLRKKQLSETMTLENQEEIRRLSEEERGIRYKLVTKEMLNVVRNSIRKEYEEDVANIRSHHISSGQMSYLLSLPKTFRKTSLRETEYTLEGDFTLEGYDTFELFNQIRVSYDVPFCSVGKFHKVLNGVTLPSEWIQDTQSEDILFYIRTELSSQNLFTIAPATQIQSKMYTKVTISLIGSEKVVSNVSGKSGDRLEVFMTRFKVFIEASHSVNEENIIEKFLNCFEEPPMDLKLTKMFGKGEYVISGISITENVFHDYVFNNPLVREFITINEKSKIYKERGKYKFQLGEELEGTLNHKLIQSVTDPEMKMFPGEISIGDTVYAVEIKKKKDKLINIREVNKRKIYFDACLEYILNTFTSRCLSWYCVHVTNIRQHIDVKRVEAKKSLKMLSSRQINPNLFQSTYSRFCNQMPKIVPEDEGKSDPNAALKFPKDVDVNDYRPQFWYKCPYDTHKYIGLRKNTITIKSKDKKQDELYHQMYPFVPCCFEQESRNTEGSLLYSYLRDENNTLDTPIFPGDKDMARGKTILKKKSPAKSTQLAELPLVIKDLLSLTRDDVLLGRRHFVRFGVPKRESEGISFITSCVMALYFQDIIKMKTMTELNQFLQIREKELIQKILVALRKNANAQSCKTIEECSKILYSREFVNPREWIDVMQQVTECNILVFYYDKDDSDEYTQLLPQRYERFYLLNSPSATPYPRTFFLYNTSDVLRYLPRHTELIVLAASIKPIQAIFSTDQLSNLSADDGRKGPITSLVDIINSQINTLRSPSFVQSANVVSQLTDSYGKIREVHFKIDGNRFVQLKCTPIAPISIKEYVNTSAIQFTQTKETVLAVLQQLKTTIYRLVYNNQVIGLVGTMKDINTSSIPVEWYGLFSTPLPITELKSYSDYDVDCKGYPLPISSSVDKPTFFNQYSVYTRQSNCLMSYMYYLFSSLYYNADSLLDSMYLFEKDHFLIDPAVQYDIRERLMRLEDSSFIRNQKLVIPSDTIKQRLLYNLKLKVEYEEPELREYRIKYKYIPNFYTSSKDFRSNDFYTVYYTAQEYLKSRENERVVYRVYEYPPTNMFSFFLKNPSVLGGDLCVATQLELDHQMILGKDIKKWFSDEKPFYLYRIGLDENDKLEVKKNMLTIKEKSPNEFAFHSVSGSTLSSPLGSTPSLLLIKIKEGSAVKELCYLVRRRIDIESCSEKK